MRMLGQALSEIAAFKPCQFQQTVLRQLPKENSHVLIKKEYEAFNESKKIQGQGLSTQLLK